MPSPQDIAETLLNSAELDELAALGNAELEKVYEELTANIAVRLAALREVMVSEDA